MTGENGMPIETQDVTFWNGNLRLAGTLHKPNSNRPLPVLVALHGASDGLRTGETYRHLVTRLPKRGIAVLAYDRRGSGESSGEFATADFSDLAQDAVAAIDFLRARDDIDHKQIGVHGFSQGGWIAPIVAARRSEVAYLIIVSGSGVSPAEQMNYGARYALEEAGYTEIIVERAIALRSRVNDYFRGRLARDVVQAEIEQVRSEPWFQYSFVSKDLPRNVQESKWYHEMDYDPLPIWESVAQPTLFHFAEDDRWVPIAESMSRFRHATAHIQDVTMMRIQGTDHEMKQDGRISESHVEQLCAWLTQRVS